MFQQGNYSWPFECRFLGLRDAPECTVTSMSLCVKHQNTAEMFCHATVWSEHLALALALELRVGVLDHQDRRPVPTLELVPDWLNGSAGFLLV